MSSEEKPIEAILEKNRRVAAITKLQGWPDAKADLMRRMYDMVSLLDADLSKPDALVNMMGRQMAFRVIMEWVLTLEGAELTEELLSQMTEEGKDDFIRNIAS